jgi:hypothetical protein
LFDELGWEEALAAGDDLTQFDVRGSERFDRSAKSTRDIAATIGRVGVSSTLLLDVPRHERSTYMPSDREHPRTRRHATRGGEGGNLGASGRTETLHEWHPRDVRAIECPGRVLGECAPIAVVVGAG